MASPKLIWEDGSILLYDSEDADESYAQREKFFGVIHVHRLTDTSAKLMHALSLDRLGLDTLIRIARCLYREGFHQLFLERALGHRMPGAERILDGPLASWWCIDLDLVLAGQGGDY